MAIKIGTEMELRLGIVICTFAFQAGSTKFMKGATVKLTRLPQFHDV